MELRLVETIIYGLVSGITEFLPVSSQAHRAVLLKLFGCSQDIPLLRLFVHLGCMAGLLTYLRGHLSTLRKQAALKKIPPRRRNRFPDPRYISELSLLKMAAVPIVIAMLFYSMTVQWNSSLQLVAIFSIMNGVVLLLPYLVASGNKDARSISRLDRLLIGFSSFLSVLPGVSRVGVITSTALVRGVDRENAYQWSLLLSLPALAVICLWDVYFVAASMASSTFLLFIAAILAGVAAFVGTWIAVSWMHSLITKTTISGFGYYSLGMALFAFILYLI